jgi:HEAT repeats
MSTTVRGRIASRIQDELANGRTDAEILNGLTASGLSRASAEHFLEKARSAPPTPGRVDPDASQPPPSMTGTYRHALPAASAMAAQIVILYWVLHTGVVQLPRLLLGPVLVAFLWVAYRAARSVGATTPRPWRVVGWSALLPMVLGAVLFGYSEIYRPYVRATAARQAAVAEMSALDRQAAETRRDAEDAARLEQARRDDERLLTALGEDRVPTSQCTAALDLGRTGRRAHVPVLYEVLRSSRFDSVKGCAAAGLVELGEVGAMLGLYEEWARGPNPDLRRSALSGFGNIGPDAASVALPHLSAELESPYASTRYVTVRTLSKLGNAARPLLERAANDPDAEVREYARAALASPQGAAPPR